MTTLIVSTLPRPFRLTPGVAGRRYIRFEVHELRQGESFARDLGGRA